MDMISFHGSIETPDADLVSSVLRSWLETTMLDIKVGRIGVEIVFENSGSYLYCHEAATDSGRVGWYLLEGHFEGTLKEVKVRLERLVELFRTQNVKVLVDYVQIDENGDWLGEELSV